MPSVPPYDLRIEPDGSIAIHDWRPELRRQIWRYWLWLIAGVLFGVLCLWGASLALEDMQAGIRRYGTGWRSTPTYLLMTAIVFACSGGSLALWALWKKAVLLRRLLHAPADLILAPDRVVDRWGKKWEIRWRDIARARLGIRDGAAAIRLDMTGGDTVTLSPLYGPAALPLAFDTLFVLARHLPVEGLPAGYRPHHPALRLYRPPAANLTPPAVSTDADNVARIFVTGRKASPLLILGGLFLCFGALVMILANQPGRAWKAMGWFGLLFFGAATLKQLVGGTSGNPDFQADETGLRFDNLAALGFIPWSSVNAIDGWSMGKGAMFGFAIPDLAERIATLPPMLRLHYRLRTGGSPIILRYLERASLDPLQAIAQMRRWRCRALTETASGSGAETA